MPTIDPTEYEKIKRMYQNGLVPMIKLAEKYHVSRQAIYKLLCRLGVDTKKNGGIEFTCYQCKKKLKRHKSRIRVRSNHRFCSLDCWFAFVRQVCDGKYK